MAPKNTKELFTAARLVKDLTKQRSAAERARVRRFFTTDGNPYAMDNKCLGVRMGTVFALAKKHAGMSLDEVERLLESPYYEVRMGAVSIMDFQARDKKTSESRRKELFKLYLRKHDRINNWDLVDRAAPYVVGSYLVDKPRKILYRLARSRSLWERRTAIVATGYFVLKHREVDDTFALAEILVNDKEELIQKAVGSWIREAGKKDPKKLLAFLDRHATRMPRTMLRYAVEKLDSKQRERYLRVQGIKSRE